MREKNEAEKRVCQFLKEAAENHFRYVLVWALWICTHEKFIEKKFSPWVIFECILSQVDLSPHKR